MYRIGHGYDAHRLVPDRALVLGGVSISYEYGLLGHSDADVLTHALMDALLGAAALGDIGALFPDNDERYRGIGSLWLLERVMELIRGEALEVVNADSTIIAQKPRLAPFIMEMRTNLSKIMDTDIKNVSVKATTEEKMGFTGKLEGISAHAVVLLKRKEDEL